MQKWHINSAVGRGRPVVFNPRSTIVSVLRYVSTSAPRGQEEPSKPLPGRAQRLQEATSSKEDLYRRFPARDGTYKPIRRDPRHVGVPINTDVLEGDAAARPSDTIQRRAGTAVDARSLGARPERAQRSVFNRSRMPVGTDQPPVDARRLGARPGGAQGSFSIRKTPTGVEQPAIDARSFDAKSERVPKPSPIKRVLRGSPAERQGPSERSTFRSRNSGGGNTNPIQDRTTRGGFMSTRSGRRRAPRDRDEPRARRRKGGAERGSGGDNRFDRNKTNWTAEEKEYLEEKEERESQFQTREYKPVEIGMETFTGMVPATASNELSMSEMLRERLVLARKNLNREVIQWDSKEQKADVMALVEKLKTIKEGRKTEEDAKKAEIASPASANGNQPVEALMQKLIAGEYAKFKRLEERDILGHVERHVHRNDSFYPDDEKSLLEKVRSIMPAMQTSKARGARNEAKV